MHQTIRQQLQELAEEEYRLFSGKLLPNIDNLLGVRLPLLRGMAKQLVKQDWRAYLLTAQDDSMEEVMLQGMVIGYARCTPEERLEFIRRFVPKINNWSVCDSFCNGLKFTQKNKELVWDFLQPYFCSPHEYEVRFAVVMLLCHYLNAEYVDRVFPLLDSVTHPGYYVKMAVAWAVSACYVRFPQQTMQYLQQNRLDDVTYNKALQKITESLKVDKPTKEKIRAMKRKS